MASDYDVSCPHCKVAIGERCVSPKGMLLYKRLVVNGRTIKVHSVHKCRTKRSIVLFNLGTNWPVKRERHRHPAVGSRELLPGGGELLHVRFGLDEAASQ